MKWTKLSMVILLGGLACGCVYPRRVSSHEARVFDGEVDRQRISVLAKETLREAMSKVERRVVTGNFELTAYVFDHHGYAYVSNVLAWSDGKVDTELMIGWSREYCKVRELLADDLHVCMRIAIIDKTILTCHARIPEDMKSHLTFTTGGGREVKVRMCTEVEEGFVLSPLTPSVWCECIVSSPDYDESKCETIRITVSGIKRIGDVSIVVDTHDIQLREPARLIDVLSGLPQGGDASRH